MSGANRIFETKVFTSGLVCILMLSTLVFSQFESVVLGQDQLVDIIEKAEKSVIRIEVEGVGGGGIGSGYVISEGGMLVTNVHVLAGARRAVGVFEDGRKFEIRGTYVIDANRDICVAQLDGNGFTTIPLASTLPRKGEAVIALGAPRGLSFSATRGIVSAIRPEKEVREMIGNPKMEGTWIQTDAAISGGNSGGPLIDSNGQVVGMSTLGSVGDAQNLNFGISITDIRSAVEIAKNARLIDLSSGVGKVEMAEVQPEATESLITRSEIPLHALEDYIERGRLEYRDLSRDLKKAATDAKKQLEKMRNGELGNTNGAEMLVVQRGNFERYYFPSEVAKRRRIAEQQSYTAQLDRVKNQLGRDPDNDSLYALLSHGGPWLDPRNLHSVGFMRDAIVLQAFGDHDVIVVYDGLPYLMWVKSTAGLSSGQPLKPAPVFVAGTQTMVVPGQGPQSVTILNSVTDSELKEAIYGKSAVAEMKDDNDFATGPEYSMWTDSTGKFQIEAKLVDSDERTVTLEEPSGRQVTLAISKLSKEDQRRVRNR
ncbi:MAG TPA: trypsin-like peptidase domain-containing protein [Pirellulaceae bacterium]|nr:trypsin-like peptidase domain-containing protein [Pirellulaceae bacterium]HMO90819.1 trypsin-like peptidase domain-containing protein [Pirellulaceae bacterium]HMP68070.1 trypsin-like peptidase domain-containing protein [Pirellulaceae bacterium]